MTRHFARHGFTIIELAVSAVATIVLIGVVHNLFTTNVGGGAIIESEIDLTSDARMAIHRMTLDVKRSHQVKVDGGKLALTCFTGKPLIGFPNNGTAAAQVEAVEYYLEKSDLVRNNLTTHEKKVIAKNVQSFKPILGKNVVGLTLQAEVEVYVERQKYDKVEITLYEKVYPVYLAERSKYKGYFCSVDEDGSY